MSWAFLLAVILPTAVGFRLRPSNGHVSQLDANTNAKYDSDGITIAPAAPPREEAKEFIRNMARHTWKNYKEKAFGHDEVTPEDGHARDNWGGHAVTLVDSLSTLYIMKLYKEFEEGVEFLDKNLIDMISKQYDFYLFISRLIVIFMRIE